MSEFMQAVGDQLVAHATECAQDKHARLLRRFKREAADAVGGPGLSAEQQVAFNEAMAPLLPLMVARQIQKTQDALAATITELVS